MHTDDRPIVDWAAWHQRYEPPNSPLARRLVVVQSLIDRWLDRSASRPVRVLSICAGDARDILQVLAGRRGGSRIPVILLEQDPRLCEAARAFAAEAGLGNVEIRTTDASVSDAYANLGVFDLVLIIGVFGNIADDDIRAVIDMLPAICAPAARVIWTRRPKEDLLSKIGEWFAARSFVELSATRGQRVFHVAMHRFAGASQVLRPGEKLFSFVG